MQTGIPELDVQHREIIDRFNEFSEAIASSRLSAIDQASEVLDFLQFYAVWHFEREEECFEQHRCPAAAANKKAHAQFVAMFGEFYEQWQTRGMNPVLAKETFDALALWIVNHIRRTDTQLMPCVHRGEQQ